MHLSLYNNFISWLESHQGTCFYKRFLGIECPGCGMQRAFIELLKGNILESIILYPALFPLLFTLIYLVFHLIFNFKHGALVLKFSLEVDLK